MPFRYDKFSFLNKFPTKDEDACLDFLLARIYGQSFPCPRCGANRKFSRLKTKHRTKQCQCSTCKLQMSITSPTIMKGTHESIWIWFDLIRMMLVFPLSLTACTAEREYALSRKKIYFMMRKIRTRMWEITRGFTMSGVVMMDESVFGGKENSYRHRRKPDNKCFILTMTELMTNRTVSYEVERLDKENILPYIVKHVIKGSTIVTDDAGWYRCLRKMGYHHEVVNHSKPEYINKRGFSTNAVEGAFAANKAMIEGPGRFNPHKKRGNLIYYVAERDFKRSMKTVDIPIDEILIRILSESHGFSDLILRDTVHHKKDNTCDVIQPEQVCDR